VPLRALVTLLALLLLAACGGGSSRESYVADALEICEEAETRLRNLGTPESFAQTQLYARQAKDAVGDQIRDLRELSPPPELEAAYANYLATLERRLRQLELLADAADRNRMDLIQESGSELDVLTARARTEARRAGIAGCESG
jgi:hypothetical protein